MVQLLVLILVQLLERLLLLQRLPGLSFSEQQLPGLSLLSEQRLPFHLLLFLPAAAAVQQIVTDL